MTLTRTIAQEYLKNAKKPQETHAIFFSEAELQDLEEILWEKSNILQAIADELIYRSQTVEAERLDNRSKAIEDLARRIGLPLDTKYVKEINNAR